MKDRSIIQHREKVHILKPLVHSESIPYRDALIPLKANARIPVRVYRPPELVSPYPTILYIPGTAFIAREIAFTEIICTHFARQSACQVILIFHGLAPEEPFPKGLQDAYNVVNYILNSPNNPFYVDKNKAVLVGYSSGANFCASIAIHGKNNGLSIQRYVLISPIVDLSRISKKFIVFENKDFVITNEFVEWFLELYVPKNINRKNRWLSPFWQPKIKMQGLPPTDIVFGENDRFRGDAEAYCDLLIQADVDVRRFLIEGSDHSFLWYKLNVVQAIGARIKMAVGNESIKTPLIFFNKQASDCKKLLAEYSKKKECEIQVAKL